MTLTPVERLRQDHAVIRAKLTLLDNALRMGSDASFAIRELVYSLSRRLAEHEEREDAELYPVVHETLAGPQDEFAKSLAMEHEDHECLLRALHLLTLRGMRMPLAKVTQLAQELIGSLREHMDREERLLFPVLDRLTADREANARTTQAPAKEAAMQEPVTINRIIRQYPEVKQVFDGHCIDCWREGEDFLDEVAWRHAVPVHELLHELREVARATRHDEEETKPLALG